LVARWFFVAAKGLVSGISGKMLEFHGGGRVARGVAEVGADLASLEDRCSGLLGGQVLRRCEQVRNRMVFALGEFKGAT
jgi:hypothetical protein